MRSSTSKAAVRAAGIMVAAALGVGGASAATTQTVGSATLKPPVCTLSQISTAAKPCGANPAFAKAGCAAFEGMISSLVGSAATAGANRSPGSLSCYFIVNGKRQAVSFSVSKGPASKSYFGKQYDADVADVATSGKNGYGCSDPATQSLLPENEPQKFSGLGDAAFSWENCPPGHAGGTWVYAVKGTVLYSGVTSHPETTLTVGQLTGLVRHLMARYH